MAQDGGVLVRAGHTEAGCDLARLAGLEPAAVICEILKDDGTMARLPDLRQFASRHGLKIGTIADLIHHRSRTEALVERAAERTIRTAHGEFSLVAYRDGSSAETHLALVKGEPAPERETLVRVHEPLSVFDLLDDDSHAHAWSVASAMQHIQRWPGAGVIVLLLRPESRDALIERIRGTESAIGARPELRDHGIGAQILRDLGVGKMENCSPPRAACQHDRLRTRK